MVVGRWGIVAGVVTSLLIGLLGGQSVRATQTAPYTLNYQGQLTNSARVALPDGQYNMTFRLFSALSGGSAVWSEVHDQTNRVTLTGGQFAVQLGAITALSPSLFTTQPLYLEVELPTLGTATCGTAACATYSEGPMTPRQALASSATAMNADTLDGFDASSFAGLSSNNTFVGTNLFKNASNSSAAFGVQQADGTALFAIDTSAGTVSLGMGGGVAGFGYKTVGGTIDTGDADNMNFSRYQTGTIAGTTSQVSVYVSGTINAAPNNKFKMAIYSGTTTQPTNLIAASSEGTLVSGWNTVSITATLNPSTNYWVGYNTNALTEANDMNYDSTGVSFYQVNAYANGYPSTIASGTAANQAFSMYVDFIPVQPSLTVASGGKIGVSTISPATTLEVDGTGLFKNASDSTTAFQIQSSTAASLFVADTTNSRIQIGSATADATAVLLVLDTKNTAGDPAGVAGAMYYNSSLGRSRCYQNSVWDYCTGLRNVILGSDVTNNNSTANTLADVTGLSFVVVAGQVYHFSALINYTSAATTTGSRWSINGPATSALSYTSNYTITATTQTINSATAYNIPAASNAGSLTVGNIAKLDGTIKPSAGGTVIVRFASGVASSAITAKAGSSLTWW